MMTIESLTARARKLVKAAGSLADSRIISSVTYGMVIMVPLLLAGALGVLINNFPVPGYPALMARLFGPEWQRFGDFLWNGSFGIMAVCVILSISFTLAAISRPAREGELHSGVAALVSLAAFFILLARPDGTISITSLGPNGIFFAILVSISSVSLFLFFFRHRIFRSLVVTDDADPQVAMIIQSIEPTAFTLSLFALFRLILLRTGIGDLNALAHQAFFAFFTGLKSDYLVAILFNLAVHAMWVVGIHGNNVLDSIARTLFSANLYSNSSSVALGYPPSFILTKPTLDVFVFIGGCGSSLCLLAAVLIAARKGATARIARMSLVPCLFNISELMVFGLPIVLNPILVFPFLLVPVLLTTTTWLAMSAGLVPLCAHDVAWTTPSLIGGFLATGSIRGSILVVVNFALGTAVYYPFVLAMEYRKSEKNRAAVRSLEREVCLLERGEDRRIIGRRDTVGNLARILAKDLESHLNTPDICRLEYQPQVDDAGRVVGAEALIRWKHPRYGRIAPPTMLRIAQEAGMLDSLGNWIIRTSCAQLARLRDSELLEDDFVLSFNISPIQLAKPGIVDILADATRMWGLDPSTLKVEFTESAAVNDSPQTQETIRRIREMGFRLAMDDFSMGHSSLLYLKKYDLDTLKFDGEMVRDIVTNRNSREILASVVSLCDCMGIRTIAEYVESKEQRDILRDLGCRIYQGYYFSPPLAEPALISFLGRNRADIRLPEAGTSGLQGN